MDVINNLQEPDMAGIILPLIVLIVFIIFIGGMLYLLISSGFQTTNPQDPVSSDNRQQLMIQCPPGDCATNLISGFKTCPSTSTQTISVNPAQDVCNSPFLCDNLLTPYSLNSDGS